MSQADVPIVALDDLPAGAADGEPRLVDGLRRGDPAAANELVERYGARAYRLALAISRDAAYAEQVVQDALGTVIRRIDTFRGDAALGSWLYRIVTSAACERMRRRAAHARAEISLEEVLPTFHEDAPAAAIVDWSERVDDPAVRSRVPAVLSAAIDELSPEDRAVVLVCDVEGLTIAEAAAAIGISVAGARARLNRARLFLRKRLALFMAATS